MQNPCVAFHVREKELSPRCVWNCFVVITGSSVSITVFLAELDADRAAARGSAGPPSCVAALPSVPLPPLVAACCSSAALALCSCAICLACICLSSLRTLIPSPPAGFLLPAGARAAVVGMVLATRGWWVLVGLPSSPTPSLLARAAAPPSMGGGSSSDPASPGSSCHSVEGGRSPAMLAICLTALYAQLGQSHPLLGKVMARSMRWWK